MISRSQQRPSTLVTSHEEPMRRELSRDLKKEFASALKHTLRHFKPSKPAELPYPFPSQDQPKYHQHSRSDEHKHLNPALLRGFLDPVAAVAPVPHEYGRRDFRFG